MTLYTSKVVAQWLCLTERRVREEMEYWAGKLAEAEAEDKHGGRNRAYRAVARDV